MKIKHFVLLTMCTALCALGCACEQEQPSDSGSSSTPPTSSDAPVEELPGDPTLTVSQSSVTVCVGESFTLTAGATEIDDPVFAWSMDGDAASDVVSLTPSGNTATVTALKVGTTKLVVSVMQGEDIYFKTVEITVKEGSDVVLDVGKNIGFDKDGYYVRLSTLATSEGQTSIVPGVSVYKNNKLVPNVPFTWTSENTEIVKTEGNKLVSVAEGKTYVEGVCTVDDAEYSIRILVDVFRPTVALNERKTVETENLTALSISSILSGIAYDVTYNGESVGSYDMQSKTVTLEKSKLPTYASELGEGKQLVIETNQASYTLSVDMYTKILYTKEDLDGFATLSKNACMENKAIWDGYFVLGSDIEYNGVYKSKVADLDSLWAAVEGNWSNGGLYGFRGVFDGKGHNVEGISIDNGAQLGSFFGVLHIEGVVKNLSFTKASVAANSSLVCGAGGGSVENVYVQYDSVGAGAQHYEGDGSINTHCATFYGFKEPTATANVSNCVVDVTKATLNGATSIKLIGSEYASIKNCFVIGGSKEMQKASGATQAFDTFIDFVEDNNVQSKYQKFDGEFWSMEEGVPVSKSVYVAVAAQGVAFTETVTCLVSGTAYKFLLNNSFVKLTADNANVTIQSGVATVSPTVQNGEKVVIMATSIFNGESDSFECDLAAMPAETVDLTKGAETAYYDITLGAVYFADLAEQVTGEVLYYLNEDFTSAVFAKDGEKAKTLIAVTAEKFYKFNCLSVTKVIENAEDLLYMRRDDTVESYGNKGCYDGKLLGTYVLLNDVDASSLVLGNTGRYWENSRGFAGTFDGRGHTISGLTVGENGFFGTLTYATIQNVKFTNVRLHSEGDGAYVSLLATRVFNTVIKDVEVQFTQYVTGEGIHAHSGLLFYEASFDSTFTNVIIDISAVSGVKYLTECYYDSEVPYLSEKKSVYENITVIVASTDSIPAFAYRQAKDAESDVVEYPEGCFDFQTKE